MLGLVITGALLSHIPIESMREVKALLLPVFTCSTHLLSPTWCPKRPPQSMVCVSSHIKSSCDCSMLKHRHHDTGKGLKSVTDEKLATGFQVSEQNPILGLDSRAALLRSLGESLLENPGIFGEQGRPGNLVDYMINTAENSSELDVLKFWDVLQTLLIPCWPKDRTTVSGFPIGDAWPLSTLKKHTDPSKTDGITAGIQPFHKLTQWLTYSLMVPFQRILGIKWKNTDSLTALPEYRNGGLFVDLGAITLKKEAHERGIKASGKELPLFDAGDDVVVEWRALTLSLLDRVYESIISRMGQGVHLSMAQVLEAGTWKSGREIAAQRRPETKSSPILIQSDGTVF
ncbi:hypothetical protein FJTKL_09087 [Diaporthe vaccinii]|uniref:DUF1688 domain-containing protein n=1 Tax=Diaporthe vaccinii TaxID=105482 RepID=A0ABR4EPL9_9PEZI